MDLKEQPETPDMTATQQLRFDQADRVEAMMELRKTLRKLNKGY